jgi:hypothetical protein
MTSKQGENVPQDPESATYSSAKYAFGTAGTGLQGLTALHRRMLQLCNRIGQIQLNLARNSPICCLAFLFFAQKSRPAMGDSLNDALAL